MTPAVAAHRQQLWLAVRPFLRHPVAGARWLWHVSWLSYWTTLQVRQRTACGRPDDVTIDRVHHHARGLWRAGRSL